MQCKYLRTPHLTSPHLRETIPAAPPLKSPSMSSILVIVVTA